MTGGFLAGGGPDGGGPDGGGADTWGSQPSQRGRYQFRGPSSFITAASSARTTDGTGQVTGHRQDHDSAEPRRDCRPRVTGAPPAGRSGQPARTAHTPSVRPAFSRGKGPKTLSGRQFGRGPWEERPYPGSFRRAVLDLGLN